MSNAEVGALRVRLAMNTVDFTTGSNQAMSVFDELKQRVIGFAFSWQGAITAAIAASVMLAYEFKTNFSKAVDEMDNLSKTAQKIGLTVEALSQLEFAAKLADVSNESLAIGLKKLSVNLQDVMKDGSKPATEAFKVMGLSVTDAQGHVKNAGDIILDVADKFAVYRDGVNKTAISNGIFGKSGNDLIPILNMGREKIQELMKQSSEYGYTVSTTAANATADFNDKLKEIGLATDGWYRQLVTKLMPTLLDWIKIFEEMTKSTSAGSVVLEALNLTLKVLAQSFSTVGFLIDGTTHAIGLLVDQAYQYITLDWTKASENWDKAILNMAQTQATYLADTARRWDTQSKGVLEARSQYLNSLSTMSDATKSWSSVTVTELTKVQEKIDAPSLARSQLAIALETITKEVGALKTLQDATSDKPLINLDFTGKESLDELNKKLNVTKMLTMSLQGLPKLNQNPAAAVVLEQYNKALAYGKQINDEYATPLEKIEKAQSRINEAYRIGAINANVLSKAQQENGVYSQKNLFALADATTSALNTIFGQTKAVAIATALINTYKGITTALSDYPPPISFAMAALQAAAGFAQVANIRNTTSTTSSGSTSGVGSTAAVAAATAAAAPQTQSLRVEGINPMGLFSGDVVRGLAQRLVDFQKDGGKVVIA